MPDVAGTKDKVTFEKTTYPEMRITDIDIRRIKKELSEKGQLGLKSVKLLSRQEWEGSRNARGLRKVQAHYTSEIAELAFEFVKPVNDGKILAESQRLVIESIMLDLSKLESVTSQSLQVLDTYGGWCEDTRRGFDLYLRLETKEQAEKEEEARLKLLEVNGDLNNIGMLFKQRFGDLAQDPKGIIEPKFQAQHDALKKIEARVKALERSGKND